MSRADAVYDVLRLVRPLTLASARAVEAGARERRLTVGTRAVLELLVRLGPRPVPALARELEVTRQAVQSLVDDLRSHGYVEPRPNPEHRRSVLIAPTDRGLRAFRELHAAERRRLGAMLRGVTDEDLATTTRVLAALLDDVRARTDAHGAGS